MNYSVLRFPSRQAIMEILKEDGYRPGIFENHWSKINDDKIHTAEIVIMQGVPGAMLLIRAPTKRRLVLH